LKLTAYYDNSTDNPRNPNNPPKPVKYGEQTTDEMSLGIVGFTADVQVNTPSSPQLTSVSVDGQGNLVVTGNGILAGADIEIGGKIVRDTRVAGTNIIPLLSSEYWKVLSPAGEQVQVTVLNPDGVRSAAQPFTRSGTARALASVSRCELWCGCCTRLDRGGIRDRPRWFNAGRSHNPASDEPRWNRSPSQW
jgi:hypothetical protein